MKRRVVVCVLLVGVVMGLPIEAPDWHRVITLVGVDDGGDPQIVLVDTSGNLIAVMKGDDSGTLRTVKVDDTGQMYTLIKGSGGEDVAVDANGNLSMVTKGLDGATLRTVAVDGAGNIVAVMQGDDGGTLRTAAVNADGRFQIVPYDPDDIWGNAIGMGNAELAGILSPAKRFDRRGNVYHIDSFDSGLGRVTLAKSGAGSLCSLSNVRARTGAYSIKATHGGAVTSYAGFYTEVPHYTDTNVGAEISFTKNAWLGYFRMFLTEYEAGTYYTYGLRWFASTERVQYYGSDEAWHIRGPVLPIYTSSNMFNTMKLVIDQTNHKYLRWMVNNANGTLIDISPASGSLAISDHLHVSARAYGSVSGASYVNIDDLIVTQNEPPN